MRKRILLISLCIALIMAMFAGCSQTLDEDDATSKYREITDMAGRAVTIPTEIHSVFSTSASGTIMLYTIDPELLIGVNYEFNDAEKEFILEEYRDLPAFGQGGKINQEAIIAEAPDICITYGTLSETDISEAENFMNQTGIPVVMLDGSLSSAADTYRFLGGLLNTEERTDVLAAYAENALEFAEGIDIPDSEKVSVYYGNGLESLETAPVGSPHAELLALLDGINVASLEGEITSRIDISAEQIISWNPEVIILNGEPTANMSPIEAVDAFKKDTRYQNVDAVVNNKVFAIPKYPFSWFDRPPSINRLIGISWLAAILYPDQVSVDIEKEARDFYSLFYHMDITENQLDTLLGISAE